MGGGKVRLLGGGIPATANLLNQLTPIEAQKILAEMRKKDPSLTAKIQNQMVTIDDLQYLSVTMLIELFRDLPLAIVGLSFRMVDEKVKEHVLTQISQSMREQIEEIMNGPPQKRSEVQKAQQKVIEVLREKIKEGKIVVLRGGEDQFV